MWYLAIPPIVCVLGLAVYALTEKSAPRAVQPGLHAFWCGLIVTLLQLKAWLD